jgi:hypothetical protein
MSRNRQSVEPSSQLEELSVGRMIITCSDDGGLLIPTVEFDPVGKISQGWFDRHVHVFLREIQKAQVMQRTQRAYGSQSREELVNDGQ